MPVDNCNISSSVKIPYLDLVNLYGCTLGADVFVGPFVEIQVGVEVGARSRIQSHSFLCEGVEIEEDVFIGHGVTFINDRYPQVGSPWELERITVRRSASIGSNSTILCGVTIGESAMVGAGSVVTKDVPPFTIVVGNPAKVIRKRLPTVEPKG